MIVKPLIFNRVFRFRQITQQMFEVRPCAFTEQSLNGPCLAVAVQKTAFMPAAALTVAERSAEKIGQYEIFRGFASGVKYDAPRPGEKRKLLSVKGGAVDLKHFALITEFEGGAVIDFNGQFIPGIGAF